MSLVLTILLSLISAALLAGRVYEILYLTDTTTGFLMVNGVVFNAYIPAIFAVIVICCGVIVFAQDKTVAPFYSKSSRFTAALAAMALVAAGAVTVKTDMTAAFFIAGGLALLIIAIAGLGERKTDVLVMILLFAFTAGLCLDVVSFDVSTYYNTAFLHKTIAYVCMISFMLTVLKNVYMPSKGSKMTLYILGVLSFAGCSMFSIAEIISYVVSNGQFAPQLVREIAFAMFGLYAFDNAVSAIPSKEKPHREPSFIVESQYTEESNTQETDKSHILPQETEQQTETAEQMDELEQIFSAIAAEKAQKNNKEHGAEQSFAQEVALTEETPKDTSRYQLVSELFKEEKHTEITLTPENNISETRSFKKFSEPKLEESAPEYDMLKSIFKGEDLSQYNLTEDGRAVRVEKEQIQQKKRSLFGSRKEKKNSDEIVSEKQYVQAEETVTESENQPKKTPSKNKVVYKKPK